MRLCEALVTALASNTKVRLDQTVFVYRLTFRWPKSDCDVDNCTSKYYLIIIIIIISNYIKVRPKASGAGLVCRTDQYFQCQGLITPIAGYILKRTITQNYSADFHKIRQKGGTWTKRETIRFWRLPLRLTLGLRLGKGKIGSTLYSAGPSRTPDISIAGIRLGPHPTVCFTRRYNNSKNFT